MKRELPARIYRSLHRAQSEAQETLLLVSDAFQFTERLQRPEYVSEMAADIETFQVLNDALLDQWDRFVRSLRDLEAKNRHWDESSQQ